LYLKLGKYRQPPSVKKLSNCPSVGQFLPVVDQPFEHRAAVADKGIIEQHFAVSMIIITGVLS
jgi:hypothetical protein